MGHHLLLAHAAAVEVYRLKHQARSPEGGAGRISIALSADWTEPLHPHSPSDIAAADRRQAFQWGWFADPIWRGGRYPATMVERVGGRLPVFTPEQAGSLNGSVDFIAVNHYTSRYAYEPHPCPNEVGGPSPSGLGWLEDQCVTDSTTDAAGAPIGLEAGSDWLYVVPWGFKKLLGA